MHAVVIGAGPAGSIAAISLRRRGDAVTLIEQHRFPRDKVCGECLSALGVQVLEKLGLTDRFRKPANHPLSLRERAACLEQRRKGVRADQPTSLVRTIVYGRHGENLEIPLPRPMWGISRKLFDTELLNAARDAGAKILQPSRCESLSPLRVRDLTNNTLHTIDCDHIYLADGKPPDGHAITDFGLKAHFINVDAPPDAIGLYSLKGHYVGLAPIENDLWNIAFSIPKSTLRATANYDDLAFENPSLARQIRNATRTSDWLIAPLPRFTNRENLQPNVTAIGNAFTAIEPIGGEGIGLAMASGYALGADSDLWQHRPAACRAAARVISSPLADVALDFAAMNQSLVRPMMALMGKSSS